MEDGRPARTWFVTVQDAHSLLTVEYRQAVLTIPSGRSDPLVVYQSDAFRLRWIIVVFSFVENTYSFCRPLNIPSVYMEQKSRQRVTRRYPCSCA